MRLIINKYMLEQNTLIMSQVIVKLFVEVEHRLPVSDDDANLIETAILKTYRAALKAQSKINLTK